MTSSRARVRRAPTPIGAAKLDEMALAYVARFATSRARLTAYLVRKIRERGWADDRAPDVDGIAERMVRLGYVDDGAFARSKARTLVARGYGARRVADGLRAAGIADDDRGEAMALADDQAIAAALRFARRRRLGPFALAADPAPALREKAVAAMVRAGHSPTLARRIVTLVVDPSLNDEEIALIVENLI